MGMCECDKDIIRIVLDSESDDRSTAETGVYEYDLRLPVKRNTYKKLILYVDNSCIGTKGLAHSVYSIHSNFSEYNSYNSINKGANTVLARVVANSITANRTTDLGLSYQGQNTPLRISTIPDSIKIEIKDIDNVGINMGADADRVWTLNLRIEAYY